MVNDYKLLIKINLLLFYLPQHNAILSIQTLQNYEYYIN